MSRLKKAAAAWHVLAVFVVVVALWGSTFIAVKHCLNYWSALQVVAGRYIFGALLLLPWAIQAVQLNGKLYKASKVPLLHLATIGSLMPVGLMTWAQLSLPSSFAGIIASLAPMMTLLMGALIWAQATRRFHWLGVVLGTSGVVVLRFGVVQSSIVVSISVIAFCAALLATVCWGLAAHHYRRHLAHVDPVLTTALSFQIMSLVMIVLLTLGVAFDLEKNKAIEVPLVGWFYLLGLGALSALAVTGYNWLIAKWGALRASACTYVVPFVAVTWGILDDEPVGWNVFIAGVLIGIAMWAVRLPVEAKLKP